jgi:hypothetical protein
MPRRFSLLCMQEKLKEHEAVYIAWVTPCIGTCDASWKKCMEHYMAGFGSTMYVSVSRRLWT